MNAAIPQPPAGSCFVIDFDEEDRPRLSWSPPDSRLARWFPAAFLAFWLCGWAVGEFFACWALLGILGNGPGGGVEWFAAAFLLFWLTMWTFGGVGAMLALAALLRGPRPERLTLAADALLYDPGASPLVQAGELPGRRSFRSFWNPPVQEWPRGEVGPIRLEFTDDKQRLTIERGADRIEIGPTLKEPEREWLAQVLWAWAGQREAGPKRE